VLVGFNVELARALCLELNAACDIKTRPWGELLGAVRRGEADAAIAGHAITPQALASVDFTDRYFHAPGRFAARRSAEKVEVTPANLDGKRIGVARNTAHEAFLRAFFRESVIQTFDSVALARDALASSNVDYVFDDGVSLLFWANGSTSRECCELRGGPFLEPKYFGDGIAIAVPKNDPQLRMLLNQALARIRQSGRYEELMLRYFPTRVF
jgi:polar amino acid transport system substrate-binding protein